MIAEVVTGAPSLNEGDPLMRPEIVLSLSSFQFVIVGTPRGALTDFATDFALGVDAGSGADGPVSPPSPKRENVGLPLTAGTSIFLAGSLLATFWLGFFFCACAIF